MTAVSALWRSPESESPATRMAAAPALTTRRSMIAAATRRLSSLGPDTGAAETCAIAFIESTIGTTARKLRLDGMISGGGAGRRHRHGLELVAPRRLRLRARHALVEPRGRDPRGGADRRRDG